LSDSFKYTESLDSVLYKKIKTRSLINTIRWHIIVLHVILL
jgi:hypothetical protein